MADCKREGGAWGEPPVPIARKVQGVFPEPGNPQPFPSWSRGWVQTVGMQSAVL